MRYILFSLTTILVSFNGLAQKFEWVNFYQGQSTQSPVSMSVDSAGNQYASFSFFNEIKFNSINLINYSNYQKGLVLKQTPEGKTLWYKVIDGTKNFQSVYPLSSRFNSKGNLMVFLASTDNIKVGTDTIKRNSSAGTSYAYFLLEFNDTGKVINGSHIIDGTLIGISYSGNKITSDLNDNIYIDLTYTGQVKVFDSTGTTNVGSTSSGSRNILFKFSKSGRKFEWSTSLPYNAILINSIKTDIHGNVYAATYWTSNTSITFKGQTLRNPQTATGAVFVYDKNGNDRSFFYIQASDKTSTVYDLAVHDSNSVYIAGNYQGDSARFDTIWKKNTKFGAYIFFAKYDINGKLFWVKIEDTTYTTALYPFNYNCGMTNYKNEYFYLSYYIPYHYNEAVIFDNERYEPDPKGYGVNFKIDDRGNILWGFRTFFPFSAMGTDIKDNFYFQGGWSGDTIRFNNFKAFPTGSDAFIGKTSDYSINRGDVYAGPYCAGDSIIIPYTKKGDFDTSNYFIAELSDEFGNFNGQERELGRVKSTNDSVVVGKLPRFKTASSGSYRIRIISTKPIVQSFYRFDKLRLLIYSVDKADPGPAETICYGDSIKLSTYGGTKWTWSPKYNMTDSSARQPFVWPVKDTVYKIIIADSSGCGEPDTAYKQIYVRKPLSLRLAFTDTIVCDTSSIKLPMAFAGGDNVSYQWKAFRITKTSTVWTILKTGKNKSTDTLFHKPKISLGSDELLALVLDDNCTNKKDTAYLRIQLLKPSKIANKFRDTIVCYNSLIVRKSQSVYTNINSSWKWIDLTSNKVLSTTDSLRINATSSVKIQLILNNGCTSDTSNFSIQVNTPIKSKIVQNNQTFNDTTLCFGQSLKLKSNNTGGSGIGTKREWIFDSKLLSSNDSLLVSSQALYPKTGGVKTIIHVIKDNCTPLGDSVIKKITVVETPVANFSFGTSCSRTATDFKFTGTVPATPINTAFNWSFEGEGSSSLENPSKLLSIVGNRKVTLSLVSTNGCRNEITKTVEVKTQAKADFTFKKDVCENDSAVFTNLSSPIISGISNFIWDLGNGKTSNKQDLKQKYQNGINPKTYSVTLIVNLKNGCSDSITKTISILEAPKADFTYKGFCNKTPVEFVFTGSGPKQAITKPFWNFNNEATSTLENPSQLFGIGTKKINLIVNSNNGCSDSITKTIEIKPQSNADFTTNDVCESDSAIFTNKSSDATTYNWKFGDGKNNSLKNPKHKYQITSTTTFNVTLVAIVKDGCSDSISKPITITQNPSSDFTYTQTGNTFDLKANKSGLSQYKWTFGTTDSITKTTHTYIHNATSTQSRICLTVTDIAGCSSQTCTTATLGVKTIKNAHYFRIYPNPASETITIEMDGLENNEYNIQLINALGQIVINQPEFEYSINNNHPDKVGTMFNVGQLVDGVYFLRIIPKEKNLIYQQKVVISSN